ncbi:hypothetical protein I7X12_19425 [Halosimplex litoreum]|uniref:Uncharacterized protein n=1 Tax=Halosimplex litoreum TaxID=1198301 RepID=A0A7T3FY68_9EURY|nr:hypothetical protein [Halosimplex litoreum]QPV62861.1 hypothetical protein I7X12_19425 [Halosimplex litoreum]
MSLSRDALLFGIALVLFGNWLQVYGLDATPFPHAGVVLAGLGFVGSVVSALHPDTADTSPTGDEP